MLVCKYKDEEVKKVVDEKLKKLNEKDNSLDRRSKGKKYFKI